MRPSSEYHVEEDRSPKGRSKPSYSRCTVVVRLFKATRPFRFLLKFSLALPWTENIHTLFICQNTSVLICITHQYLITQYLIFMSIDPVSLTFPCKCPLNDKTLPANSWLRVITHGAGDGCPGLPVLADHVTFFSFKHWLFQTWSTSPVRKRCQPPVKWSKRDGFASVGKSRVYQPHVTRP